jgi:DNA polymerase-3 subunit epsilon
MHPGQRNSLDALCGRYDIDNSRREKHGALLDAEILADVYLAMTGGQTSLSLDAEETADEHGQTVGGIRRLERQGLTLRVVRATAEELDAHERQLDKIDQACDGVSVWRR